MINDARADKPTFDFKNRFVCPIPRWLRGELLHLNRLYAYPTEPEPLSDSEFQIIDSGAYALSKQGRKMGLKYIENLAEHYHQNFDENRFFVAPDQGGSPRDTMRNFDYWHDNFQIEVVPVLQFTSRFFDLRELQYQISFYKERLGHEIPFIAFAKRGATIEEMQRYGVMQKVKYLRSQIKNQWVHFFAAGWGKHDCLLLSKMGEKFSVDTINYYQAAEIPQRNLTEWGVFFENKVEAAKHNAELANKILQR